MADEAVSAVIRGDDKFARPSPCSSEPSLSRKDFLSSLFGALDSNQIRYCVLHSWEDLPETLPSDLDMAVHPEDECKVPCVFKQLHQKGYRPVQALNYFVSAYYFVFAWFEGPAIMTVAVDFIFEHRRGGLIVPSGENLVAGRRRWRIFWIPAPEPEFAYLLAKKTWKGKAPGRQARRLNALVEQLGRTKAESLASELFLGKLNEQVVEACASGSVDALLAQLKRHTWKTSFVRSPFRLARYLVADAARRIRRWLQPTGLFIVLMGPDGAGKSTLIGRLVPAVGSAFRRHRIFHWRPMLLWRRNAVADTTQPHSLPPHPVWWSTIRLFAHLIDYWLGYSLIIRPLLARSGFVIFDRYFHDVLIDPKRYRYGGPLWLARACRRLVPRPDLLLVLDAPEQVILSRKQEVALDELQRQRALYLSCTSQGSHVRIIEASGPVSQVTAKSAQAILEYLSQRFETQHADWLPLGRRNAPIRQGE